MAETTNLRLPWLEANQAQKHVTVNESLRRLDGIVQLAMESRALTTPPGGPADGARWIVPAGASGAWAGWAGSIAYRVDGAWVRLIPRPGWIAWVMDEDTALVWSGTAWIGLASPLLLAALGEAPDPPPQGKLLLHARQRAGQASPEILHPDGRGFALQGHLGFARIARWSPTSGVTIANEGLPQNSVGTISTPTLTTGSRLEAARRWRNTSAAAVDSAAEQRSAQWACWRGNAAGLGGFTFTTRISLAALQPTGMGFFGLYGATGTLPVGLALAAAVNCIGIGFQRGTHASWQIVANDGTGAPTLIDLGAEFPVATAGLLTLHIAAETNAASVWVRVINDLTGAEQEVEIATNLPSATQFLSPRLYLSNGATAAAVAYECCGLYLETDY